MDSNDCEFWFTKEEEFYPLRYEEFTKDQISSFFCKCDINQKFEDGECQVLTGCLRGDFVQVSGWCYPNHSHWWAPRHPFDKTACPLFTSYSPEYDSCILLGCSNGYFYNEDGSCA